ncbi:MAG: peptide-methionine (S)-S-oxide reductase MsrA [Gemmatimonadales bacterium]
MTEKAVLAGGCFWCLEAVFQPLKGVKRVVSGYAGGTGPASYDAVGTGMTGHAEAVEISFDPQVISYRKLLELFFAFHDPTTLNRQGPDVGTQYRSAIFPASQEQREAAEAVIADLTEKRVFGQPIVTTVEDAVFHPGESYHQDYYRRNPTQPYCAALITPKLAKLRAGYGALLA